MRFSPVPKLQCTAFCAEQYAILFLVVVAERRLLWQLQVRADRNNSQIVRQRPRMCHSALNSIHAPADDILTVESVNGGMGRGAGDGGIVVRYRGPCLSSDCKKLRFLHRFNEICTHNESFQSLFRHNRSSIVAISV